MRLWARKTVSTAVLGLLAIPLASALLHRFSQPSIESIGFVSSRLYLGELYQGEVATGSVTLVNSEEVAIAVSLGSSCTCTILEAKDFELGPDESRDVQITMNTYGFLGRRESVLVARTKSGQRTECLVICEVIPRVIWERSEIVLDEDGRGETSLWFVSATAPEGLRLLVDEEWLTASVKRVGNRTWAIRVQGAPSAASSDSAIIEIWDDFRRLCDIRVFCPPFTRLQGRWITRPVNATTAETRVLLQGAHLGDPSGVRVSVDGRAVAAGERLTVSQSLESEGMWIVVRHGSGASGMRILTNGVEGRELYVPLKL